MIDTQTNQVVGSPIKVGEDPNCDRDHARRHDRLRRQRRLQRRLGDRHPDQRGAARRSRSAPPRSASRSPPTASTAYVSETGLERDLADRHPDQPARPPIGVGTSPFAIAITPDQPPLASFSISGPAVRARPGVPLTFNASASSDPDGTIVCYAWSFGDGQTASSGPTLTHTYGAPGTYTATLSVNRQRRAARRSSSPARPPTATAPRRRAAPRPSRSPTPASVSSARRAPSPEAASSSCRSWRRSRRRAGKARGRAS